MTNYVQIQLKFLMALFPFYTRFSLIGGSILLWLFYIQVISGILITLIYSWIFDSGLPGTIFFWWETLYGSFLSRIHSEFGNLVFLWLYVHILTKLWTFSYQSEIDHSWLSGGVILIFMYITGLTGAIMPCSILSEVTATVIGYAINSLTFIKFDFLETLIIPGLGLTDETMIRVFIIHAIFPILTLIIIIDHISNLHVSEYTDDDETDYLFLFRHEYWNEFLWIEIGFWYEFLLLLLLIRFTVDFFSPLYITISYSLSNFEYWPLTEEIDFVLAIPHWYLRPLMTSLVLIPHHYLGFFYVIVFFFTLIFLPWTNEGQTILSPVSFSDFIRIKFPADFNFFLFYTLSLLILVFIFTTLIVPTGRYFIPLGSSEFLVFAYWFLFFYLLLFSRFNIALIAFIFFCY